MKPMSYVKHNNYALPNNYEQSLILHIFLSSEGRLGETETLQRGKTVEKIIIFFCDFPQHVYLALHACLKNLKKLRLFCRLQWNFTITCPSTLRTP